MNTQPLSKKPIIIGALVIIAVLLVYFYSSSTPQDTSSSLDTVGTTSTDSSASVVGTQVLILLNQIKSLRIDPTLFNTPVYKSLVDHTVVVPEQNVGKPNPFVLYFGTTPPAPEPVKKTTTKSR